MESTLFEKALYFIGSVLILSVIGIILIVVATDEPIPDVLQNIAIGALTGLVGMLVQKKES